MLNQPYSWWFQRLNQPFIMYKNTHITYSDHISDHIPLLHGFHTPIHVWLVLSTLLKNISQLGWLFPIYGKIKVMFQTTKQRKHQITTHLPSLLWGLDASDVTTTEKRPPENLPLLVPHAYDLSRWIVPDRPYMALKSNPQVNSDLFQISCWGHYCPEKCWY